MRAIPAAPDARVFSKEYVFKERRIIRNATAKNGAPIELRFMDNKLLTGDLKLDGSLLTITGRVIDTAVRIDEGSPWTASAIEFFVRSEHGHGGIKQFFLLPREKGATLLNRERQPVKPALGTFKARIDKGGYDFTLRFNLSAPNVEILPSGKAGAFYLDFIVAAGALGDAHSSCRVGWNGTLNSCANSSHYALVMN